MAAELEGDDFYVATGRRLLERGVDRKRFGQAPDIALLLQIVTVEGVNYTVHELANGFVAERRRARALIWIALGLAIALVAVVTRPYWS